MWMIWTNYGERYCVENKRAIGKKKEELAEQYLKSQGYEILEKNFYSHAGEIDIIARDGAYLVFVEVKYRKSLSQGYASEAVNARKQQRIYRAASYYLYKNGYSADATPCRFDVVSIQGEQITVIKNAFGGF